MVVAVLADDPNYVYCLQKRTTGPETIEQRFSNSWAGTFDRNSKIALHFLFLFKLIPRKTTTCYLFHSC